MYRLTLSHPRDRSLTLTTVDMATFSLAIDMRLALISRGWEVSQPRRIIQAPPPEAHLHLATITGDEYEPPFPHPAESPESPEPFCEFTGPLP